MTTLQVINNTVLSALISDREVEFELQVSSANLLNLLDILKSHSLTKLVNLVELTATDIPTNSLRFYASYFLLSTHYNTRVCVSVQTNELLPIISVTSLFNSANWMEREVWDLFGIMFANHPDLRRILTDYGFTGHPLRKDFPLSGFTDIFYNDAQKLLVYEPVELAQSFRKFSFLSPWIQGK
jgi:NADH:ubiquinone oxidoreductase subunit C